MKSILYRAFVYFGAVVLILPNIILTVVLFLQRAIWAYIDGPSIVFDDMIRERHSKTLLERWEGRKGFYARAVAVPVIRYLYEVRSVWTACLNWLF